ncbi:YibE/F family protein [Alteromonas gracilis]
MARHASRRAATGRSGGGTIGLLLSALLVAFLAICFGLGALWTTDRPEAPPIQTERVTTVTGTVFRVLPTCAQLGKESGADCDLMQVDLTSGPERGERVQVTISEQLISAGVRPDDVVELSRLDLEGGVAPAYAFSGVDRSLPLWILAGLVVAAVVAVARIRGVLAIVGMALGFALLAVFALPALLAGRTGVGVGLTVGAATLCLVLLVAHGPRLRTLVALAGALGGMLVTALVAGLGVAGARLGGIGDQPGATLAAFVGDVRLSDVLVAAMIVAGLGVLHDVAITQTNAVDQARRREPGLTVEETYAEAMVTGREHIAATLHTIVWAYLGTSLSVIAVLYLYDRSLVQMLSSEDIAQQLIRMGASAIGLVLAVPITTRLAAHVLSHPTPVRLDA